MNNSFKNTDLAKDAVIAQFSFTLIAPVIQNLYSDAIAKKYYRRVTEKTLTFPDGSTFLYRYKTLKNGLFSTTGEVSMH